MDRAAMAARCPASKPLGLARLKRHRFFINGDGYASVMRDERAEAPGVLWDIALSDLAALDRYEEVHRGLYRKLIQPVLTEKGPRRALVYVATNTAPGQPRPGYLERVIAAAESWGLPAPHVAEMRRWLSPAPGRNPA
jgi:hypothetical protein